MNKYLYGVLLVVVYNIIGCGGDGDGSSATVTWVNNSACAIDIKENGTTVLELAPGSTGSFTISPAVHSFTVMASNGSSYSFTITASSKEEYVVTIDDCGEPSGGGAEGDNGLIVMTKIVPKDEEDIDQELIDIMPEKN